MGTGLKWYQIEDAKDSVKNAIIWPGLLTNTELEFNKTATAKKEMPKVVIIKPVDILIILCTYYQTDIDTLDSMEKCRKREYVKIRQFGHYFLKKYSKLSLVEIGLKIGKKDHASVLHSIKTINNLLQYDKEYQEDFEELDKLIHIYVEQKEMQNKRVESIGIA